ncbi:MAG: T9SS type A sorting domain-containing protein, partial [Balneolaceae bacterium]
RPANAEQLIYSPLFSITDTSSYHTHTYKNNYWDYYPLSIGFHEAATDTLLVIPGPGRIHIYDHLNPQPGNLSAVQSISNQQPILGEHFIIATNPTLRLPFSNHPEIQIQISSKRLDAQGNIQDEWTVTESANNAFISSQNGDSLFLDFTTNGFLIEDGTPFSNTSQFDFRSEIENGKWAGISGSTVSFIGENIPEYNSTSQNRLFAGTIKTGGNPLYYIFEDDAFTLVNPSLENPFVPIFEEEKAEWPAIVDGINIYRVNRTQNQLEGFNQNGALLNHMPITAPEGVQFIGTPLIADITGDNVQDILVVGQDEVSINIFAYQTSGQPVEGFPLYVGEVTDQQTQPIHPAFYGNVLYAVNHGPQADIKAWEFHEFTTAQWPARYGKNPYNKVSADVTINSSDGSKFSVLNNNETYNWPNPASDETNIRFELAEPGGSVEIQVITMSGRVIFEETVTSPGGFPQEILVNTQNWGSGGYIARVRATVEGKTETKLIKIGVLH